MAKKIVYSEPADYIPKSIRKELGLGEFAKEKTDTKKAPEKKQTKTSPIKKGKSKN